jgi:hypothetical protein
VIELLQQCSITCFVPLFPRDETGRVFHKVVLNLLLAIRTAEGRLGRIKVVDRVTFDPGISKVRIECATFGAKYHDPSTSGTFEREEIFIPTAAKRLKLEIFLSNDVIRHL